MKMLDNAFTNYLDYHKSYARYSYMFVHNLNVFRHKLGGLKENYDDDYNYIIFVLFKSNVIDFDELKMLKYIYESTELSNYIIFLEILNNKCDIYRSINNWKEMRHYIQILGTSCPYLYKY